MNTIGEIKKQFTAATEKELPSLITIYKNDERSGIVQLCQRASKKLARLAEEDQRITKLSEYERRYEDRGLLCGIDEVGRGPFAGPVVAGAVILPKTCHIRYINDSKQLSYKRREELYDIIMEEAVATGIGIIPASRIDEINILQATYEAMIAAIDQLEIEPDLLLNDAVTIPKVTIPQIPIIKGDAKSISIGAASIIAKVTRDRMMVQYGELYPEYDWASNKGYGTAAHQEAIRKYGMTPLHRRSFIHN